RFESFWSVFGLIIGQGIIFLVIFLLALLIFYRLFLLPRKLKQRLSQVQLEGIKSQLNPHFLFNSISSIQSLMNQGKTEEANTYLNDFSDLLRYHLDEGAEDLVLLSEELAALQHYCQLEQLRSPFQLEIEVDTQLDTQQIEIPNQILQIVVENAIKHGLRFTDTPILNIRLQKLKQLLRISILDNGPGIHNEEHRPSANLTIRKTHKGLELIHEKIKLLKKKGIKLKIDIKDRRLDLQEEENGTRVTLDIPLTY
ncbi:MAG: histidine kinase, partial [Bacteroidota bacterium]